MSKIEQAGYPYVEGFRGILFEGAERGVVYGGSGSKLHLEVRSGCIAVTSTDNGTSFAMVGRVKRDEVHFNLKTVHRTGESRSHHPDFFAGRFVDFALANFEQQGFDIRYWMSDWDHNSDNYKQYISLRDATGDSQNAARNTWAGAQAARHGFDLVKPEGIITENPERILVVFER